MGVLIPDIICCELLWWENIWNARRHLRSSMHVRKRLDWLLNCRVLIAIGDLIGYNLRFLAIFLSHFDQIIDCVVQTLCQFQLVTHLSSDICDELLLRFEAFSRGCLRTQSLGGACLRELLLVRLYQILRLQCGQGSLLCLPIQVHIWIEPVAFRVGELAIPWLVLSPTVTNIYVDFILHNLVNRCSLKLLDQLVFLVV